MKHIVFLMAGNSTRMGFPKESIDIHNKAVYTYPIKQARESEADNVICVINNNKLVQLDDDIEIVLGGDTRIQSIQNALMHSSIKVGDTVIFHDLARCGVRKNHFNCCIYHLHKNDIVAFRKNIHDALITDDSSLVNMPIYRVQTPIGFVYSLSIQKLILNNVLDESLISVLLRTKLPIYWIKGSVNLTKLTTPDEIPLLKWLLSHDE